MKPHPLPAAIVGCGFTVIAIGKRLVFLLAGLAIFDLGPFTRLRSQR